MVETCDIGAIATPSTQAVAWRGLWARLFSFPVVLVMSLMLVLALFASSGGPGRDVSDPDIWWHLENARQLVSTGHFMQHDTYSFTVAGQPWINFEWLSELPYYAAYQALGLRGLFLVSLALSEAIIVCAYLLCWMRSHDVKASFLAAGFALLLTCVSLAPRTLLFGWLFFAVELGVLWAYQQGRNYIWVLPPVFLVWINMHGSWLIGFAVLLLFAGCSFVRGRWGAIEATGLSSAFRNRLMAVVAVTTAVLFVNPYGWKLPLYPFNFMATQQMNIGSIAEWASLDFHSLYGRLVIAAIVLLAVASLARRCRWTLFDLLLVLFAINSGLTYTRFIMMTGIVLAPFLAVELRGVLGPYEKHLERPWLNAVALAVLAAILVWRLPSEQTLQKHRDDTFPVAALTRLQQLPPGHVFNAYEWGGYMVHATPQLPVFLDSRADVFVQHGVFADYGDAIHGTQSLEILAKYGIRYVLLPPNTAMSYLLAHNNAWRTEYRDDHSVLFARLT